jgi:hypothetical protein
MRTCAIRRCAIVVAAIGCLAGGVQAVGATAEGRLVGVTQITYDCPGPQRVGEQCDHWSPFARARFAVTRNGAGGRPITGTRRVVLSDGAGRFNLVLAAGIYTIAPLPQQHTHGGSTLTVRIHPGHTTHTTIRFLGYPMMA